MAPCAIIIHSCNLRDSELESSLRLYGIQRSLWLASRQPASRQISLKCFQNLMAHRIAPVDIYISPFPTLILRLYRNRRDTGQDGRNFDAGTRFIALARISNSGDSA